MNKIATNARRVAIGNPVEFKEYGYGPSNILLGEHSDMIGEENNKIAQHLKDVS